MIDSIMTTELACLAWAIILGLVHILVAGHVRTKQFGAKWNMSARDGATPVLNAFAERLFRAQANFFETFPLFAAAVLMVAVTQSFSVYSYWGSLLYLIARVVYFPLYAFGVPVFRTIVWLISILGLLLVLVPMLF